MDKVAVIIATRSRPALLRFTVDLLAHKSRPADRIIVVGTHANDIAFLDPARTDVTAVVGRTGSALQRNDALQIACDAYDTVVFFIDDFVTSLFWLEKAVTLFVTRADLSG